MADIQTTFEKTKITVQGLRLLTKIMLTGESLKLTRAAIGEGISDAEPSSLTALVKEVLSHKTGEEGTSATVDLQTLAATDDTTAAMRILIQNGDTEFVLREIGIYAQDPDGDEILYAYTCDKSEYAMPFPSNADGAHVSETVDIAFFVSNVENIDADITLPAEVSLAEFTAHKSAEELDHPDGSVTTEKIADDAVTQSKLANDSVAQSKIINGAVTKDKIADDAVTTDKIADNAVTADKIANDAVTLEKLAPEVSEEWEKRDAEIVITIFSLFGGIRITYETWTEHDSPGSRTRITDAEYTTDTLTKLLPAVIVDSSAQDLAGVFTTYTPGVYADKQGASFVVGIYDTFHSEESHLMKKTITDMGSGAKTIVIGSEE